MVQKQMQFDARPLWYVGTLPKETATGKGIPVKIESRAVHLEPRRPLHLLLVNAVNRLDGLLTIAKEKLPEEYSSRSGRGGHLKRELYQPTSKMGAIS